MKAKKSNILWGIVFIFAGILYMLNGFFDINISIFNFWPLFIIIPCLSSIMKKGIRIGNVLGLLFGFGFLISSLNLLPEHITDKLFIPFCLIILGIIFIFRDRITAQRPPKWVEEKFNNAKTSGYCAFFSSNKVTAPHEPFEGGEVNSIFGAVILDLRDAIITEDTIITCSCVFAGIDIFVPSGVNINVSGLPIFGGINNKSINYRNENAPTLYINATCMFGGVTIK